MCKNCLEYKPIRNDIKEFQCPECGQIWTLEKVTAKEAIKLAKDTIDVRIWLNKPLRFRKVTPDLLKTPDHLSFLPVTLTVYGEEYPMYVTAMLLSIHEPKYRSIELEDEYETTRTKERERDTRMEEGKD